MARRKASSNSAVLSPNMGLFLDRPPLAVPSRGLLDVLNLRISDGELTNEDIGWVRLGNKQLNGPGVLAWDFTRRDGVTLRILATPTDLYKYDEGTDTLTFITPSYSTGTVDVSAASNAVVTGTGTEFQAAGVKVGDQISFGSASQDSPEATWYTITNVTSDTELTISGSVAGAPLSGTAFTIRRLMTATSSDRWQATSFLRAPGDIDLWIGTNGVDYPIKWSGDGPAYYMSGLGFKCKTVATYSNMVFYGNITEDDSTVKATVYKNSNVGQPEVLNAGLAAETVLHSGSDGILTMKRLGNFLAMYCQRTIVLVQFVEGPIIFVQKPVVTGLGPMAANLVFDDGDIHRFIARDGQYEFDGASVRPYGEHVWRKWMEMADLSRIDQSFSHYNERRSELSWIVPVTAYNGNSSPIAVLEHMAEEPMASNMRPTTLRSAPFTASSAMKRHDAPYATPIVLDEDGYLYRWDSGQTANGKRLPSYGRTKRFPTADGKMRALLRRVYPFVEKQPGATLNIRTYLIDSANGEPYDQVDFSFEMSLDETAYYQPVYRKARYIEVEFSIEGLNKTWTAAGFDFDVFAGGMR